MIEDIRQPGVQRAEAEVVQQIYASVQGVFEVTTRTQHHFVRETIKQTWERSERQRHQNQFCVDDVDDVCATNGATRMRVTESDNQNLKTYVELCERRGSVLKQLWTSEIEYKTDTHAVEKKKQEDAQAVGRMQKISSKIVAHCIESGLKNLDALRQVYKVLPSVQSCPGTMQQARFTVTQLCEEDVLGVDYLRLAVPMSDEMWKHQFLDAVVRPDKRQRVEVPSPVVGNLQAVYNMAPGNEYCKIFHVLHHCCTDSNMRVEVFRYVATNLCLGEQHQNPPTPGIDTQARETIRKARSLDGNLCAVSLYSIFASCALMCDIEIRTCVSSVTAVAVKSPILLNIREGERLPFVLKFMCVTVPQSRAGQALVTALYWLPQLSLAQPWLEHIMESGTVDAVNRSSMHSNISVACNPVCKARLYSKNTRLRNVSQWTHYASIKSNMHHLPWSIGTRTALSTDLSCLSLACVFQQTSKPQFSAHQSNNGWWLSDVETPHGYGLIAFAENPAAFDVHNVLVHCRTLSDTGNAMAGLLPTDQYNLPIYQQGLQEIQQCFQLGPPSYSLWPEPTPLAVWLRLEFFDIHDGPWRVEESHMVGPGQTCGQQMRESLMGCIAVSKSA